jgi:hypothetical protein
VTKFQFHLILTENGHHRPRSDEPTFRTREDADREKAVRDSGLGDMRSQGYEWIVEEVRNQTPLWKQGPKQHSFAKQTDKNRRGTFSNVPRGTTRKTPR